MRRLVRKDQGLQQGVAGQAVGAVEAGHGHLPHRVEVGDVGPAPNVRHHPAAHVVGRGHHRDGLGGDIDPVLQALLIDVGEAALDEVRRLVADVQVDAVGAGLFHLQVDGPGHRVPGGQVFQGVVLLHEGPPGAVDEDGALAPERLGDEEILGRHVIEAGGVELDEFHVADPGPGPVGHGDAVARGDVRVAGVEIDLAHPPGGQEGDGGLQRCPPLRSGC